MIKAVFLDVDNTLTSPVTREIPASALEAIAEARRRGVKVFVATGRNTLTPEEGGILRGVQFDGYVAMNGQICYTDETDIFYRRTLDRGDASRVLALSDKLGFACAVSELREMYLNRITDRVRAFHESIKLPLYAVRPVTPDAEIFLLAVYAREEDRPAINAAMRHCVTVGYSEGAFDIIPADGGKESGLEKMLEHFGFSPEQALAMGDAENDIGMLKYAGVGVAMSGSDPHAIAAADYVAPAPENDGVMATFKKFGIID